MLYYSCMRSDTVLSKKALYLAWASVRFIFVPVKILPTIFDGLPPS
jgi:hypothetical protein